MYFSVVRTEYCSADHAEVVDAGRSISRPSARTRAKCKVVRWSEAHFTSLPCPGEIWQNVSWTEVQVKCIIPQYFKKCHIEKRCTSVWSAQSIVLLTMPKRLMRAGLYLYLQPARKQNAKSSDGAKRISQSLPWPGEIWQVSWTEVQSEVYQPPVF